MDNSTGINDGPFDRFSLVHLGVGVWMGTRGFGLLPALLMHTIWEIVEAKVHERQSPDRFVYQPEPMYNRVGDTIAFLAGWSLSLKDRLKDDPWVGETNPMRIVTSVPVPRDPTA